MRAPILFTSATERAEQFVRRWRQHEDRPAFWCVLAHTDTCLIPGLSAAGVTEEVRPFTPAADAEVVLLGAPRCLPELPSNPLDAPGPAGITLAALRLADIPATFVGAGLRVWPAAAYLRVETSPGGDIRFGRAVPDADRLLEEGVRLGREIASLQPRIVLAESVPGGTTTALAVLLAFGYRAEGRVSGSMAGNARELKARVVREALAAARLKPTDDPLRIVAELGDPMQPLLSGMLIGATNAGSEVLLAGGSQMLAIAAIARALRGPDALERVAVGTTRWIVEDPAADIVGLAAEIAPELPVLAANFDFSHSRHTGLRRYEQFLVKEGVGAGGASIAALLATGEPIERLESEIDRVYDSLVGRLMVT